MAQHGGKRLGAGRPKGSKTRWRKEDTAELAERAREHAEDAVQTILDLMREGESEQVRLNAAMSILDRGYGKPKQAVNVDANVRVSEMTDEELDAQIASLARAAGVVLD